MAGTAHEIIEKNTGLLVIFIVIAISFATLVEIVPLIFDTKSGEEGGVNQPLPTMEPWTALEFEGRDIYIREGCHVCHTKMIRPLKLNVMDLIHVLQNLRGTTHSYGVLSVLVLTLHVLVDAILTIGRKSI